MEKTEALPDVTSRLTAEQIALMLGIFMRTSASFIRVDPLVEADLFPGTEAGFYVAWKCYATVRATTKSVPPKELVQAEIQAISTSRPELVPPVTAQLAWRVVDSAYAIDLDGDRNSGLLVWANTHFQRLYANRVGVSGLQRQLSLTASQGYQLTDPMRLIQDASERIKRASGLTSNHGVRVELSPLNDEGGALSTGVQPWDDATTGGMEPRKIYGLFGPTGSFKTGFAVQLMCGMAQSDHTRLATIPGHTIGQLVYFAYECPPSEIQSRFLACAAEIPFLRIEAIRYGRTQPRTRPDMEEYEQRIASDLQPYSEVDRLHRATTMLAGVTIQNMGASEDAIYGRGYVPELVGCVENVRQQTGGPIRGVFIDYAKLMARRYNWAAGSKSKDDQGRMLLSQLPDLMRAEVSERYKTPVVILQQLDNAANMKLACSPLTHSSSSEAKDLGENMYYCLCLSKIDPRRGLTILNPSKTRHTRNPSPTVLRLDGNRSKLVAAEGFSVSHSGELVTDEDRSMMSGRSSGFTMDPMFLPGNN